MKQECVFFHTEKSLREAKNILKNEKMQIVFRSDNVQLKLSDLTEEEKISWGKFQDERIFRNLQRIRDWEQEWSASFKNSKSIYDETVHLMKELRKKGNLTKMKQILKEKLGKHMRSGKISQLFSAQYFMDEIPDILDSNEIHCSCIVAKQGDNIVRYLKFLENEDPVITITGPKASSLKLSIEGKF